MSKTFRRIRRSDGLYYEESNGVSYWSPTPYAVHFLIFPSITLKKLRKQGHIVRSVKVTVRPRRTCKDCKRFQYGGPGRRSVCTYSSGLRGAVVETNFCSNWRERMMKLIKVLKGKSFRSRLIAMRACGWEDDTKAVGWVGRKSLKTAWRTCERGDWMLWLAATISVDHKLIILAVCDCARLALPYEEGHEALQSIEVAEAWCRGEATIRQVRAAAKAAYIAVNTLFAAAFAHTVFAEAAANTVFADAVAFSASAVNADGTVDTDTLRKCAELVRARISYETIHEAMGG